MISSLVSRTLLAEGVVDAGYLEQAMARAEAGEDIWSVLQRMEDFQEEKALLALARELGLRFLSVIPEDYLDRELIEEIPLRHLREHGAVPFRDDSGSIRLAMSSPLDMLIWDELRFFFRSPELERVLVPRPAVMGALESIYGTRAEEQEFEYEEGTDSIAESEINDLLDETSDAPFIRLVNKILTQAVKAGASDVHIEPYQDSLRVRFRLDGVLYDKYKLHAQLHSPIVSRIKIMARLNIAEKRLPQDGRIELKLGKRSVDLRVSSLPTAHGERVVLRLLEKSTRILNLEELGFHPDDLPKIKKLISLPNGIILVTGPTGSGKTTSLYGVLNSINDSVKNILTIEDPVEYRLDGVGQMQVNSKIGLTFAQGLRSIVRQDPDVILIGEIRDGETAEIAIQAALTGHLVFATLHTNDAPGAVTRLTDMGVEPFLVSSTVRAIIAQRLVRLLCSHCKREHKLLPEEVLELGLTEEQAAAGTVFEPVGCAECMETGYRGRAAIFEILVVDERLQSLILENVDTRVLRKAALEEGMLSLRGDGLRKVLLGRTSLAELRRVTSI